MKNQRIGFSLDLDTRHKWEEIARDVISKKFFRSKSEIFECLIYFLLHAEIDELLNFRRKMTVSENLKE